MFALPFDPSWLAVAAKTLASAAKNYLPQFGGSMGNFGGNIGSFASLTQDNGNLRERLRDILEQGVGNGSTYPRGRNEPPDADEVPPTDPRVIESERRQRNSPEYGMTDVGRSSWFDLHRVGFLALGIALLIVGVTYIAKNAKQEIRLSLEGGDRLVSARYLSNLNSLAEKALRPKKKKPDKKKDNKKDAGPPVNLIDEERPDFGRKYNPNTVEGSIDESVRKRPGFGRSKGSRQ